MQLNRLLMRRPVSILRSMMEVMSCRSLKTISRRNTRGCRAPRCTVSNQIGRKVCCSYEPLAKQRGERRRDFATAHKRKPVHRGPSNRWDQYSEDSSATSSEAHNTSDQGNNAGTWGPWESVSKAKRQTQPYRLQQANQSDGQWSRWADDIRQSQPDQWSSSSAKWHSFAGYERSWKRTSEWDRSKWSTPNRSTLKGSEYGTDQEWHLRNMRYGDGMGLRLHSEPLQESKANSYRSLKMTGRQTHHCLWGGRELEINLASRWEGVRLPRASGKFPGFPGSSPNFPRSFSATSPEVLSLWN